MGSAFILPICARVAMAQSGAAPDASLVSSGNSSHASLVGNAYANALSSQDYSNLIALYGSLKANLLSSGSASVFDSSLAQVSSSQLNAGLLNKAQLIANIQTFQPAFQQTDLDWLLAVIPPTGNNLTSGLHLLQQKGLASLFTTTGADLIRMKSNFFPHQSAIISPSTSLNPFSSPEAIRLYSQKSLSASPNLNIHEPPSEGGGSYCGTAFYVRDVAALAFLVIGIASGIGAIGAAWGLFSVFGGGALTVGGSADRIGGC